jgi:hypothetical protein
VANVVDVEIRDDGKGSAALNVAALELCAVLFSARHGKGWFRFRLRGMRCGADFRRSTDSCSTE